MGRPIYNYELGDPDFSWLVSNFKENNPDYNLIESGGLPVIFIASSDETKIIVAEEKTEHFESPPQTNETTTNDVLAKNRE